MSTDDILWRKVDSLISLEAEKAQASFPAPQRSPEEVTASPQPRRQLVRHPLGKRASHPPSTDASTQASAPPCYRPEWVEATRKLIKTTGKEVAYTRLTSQEKGQLAEVVYGFRRQGIKTSENEVLRIAINHLLDDFGANGVASFLQRVIAALLA
jgi:hypothetical protein